MVLRAEAARSVQSRDSLSLGGYDIALLCIAFSRIFTALFLGKSTFKEESGMRCDHAVSIL
jgi:hypothetical protein